MGQKKVIGAHELIFEDETGIIVFVQNGTLGGPEALDLVDSIAEHADRTSAKAVFLMTDYRKSDGMTTEAREAMSTRWGKARDVHTYSALFGASFALRTIVNLVTRAAKMLSGGKLTSTAVATETEARAWLAEQQALFRARSQHP